jgi:glyoxylase-like metal-dependent hydrolase (beta-lactamase superfamily II)
MIRNSDYFQVATGVWGLKIVFVNVYMIAAGDHWVLVDAGLIGSAGRILKMANELFDGLPPAAIVLTHGHFDHRGALNSLLDTWNVPVYAHMMELPYLNGQCAYPPADPTVGGGLMSVLSVLYPRRPINLGANLCRLPDDGSIPFLPQWLYIATPGHSPGHISLYRSKDRLLIAGDAFVTTKQESAIATLFATKQLNGPPKYFTPDWISAKASVNKLWQLRPSVAATGHGMPMRGKELLEKLGYLADNFEKEAVPSYGRYIHQPAVADRHGIRVIPPHNASAKWWYGALLLGAVVALPAIVYSIRQYR